MIKSKEEYEHCKAQLERQTIELIDLKSHIQNLEDTVADVAKEVEEAAKIYDEKPKEG